MQKYIFLLTSTNLLSYFIAKLLFHHIRHDSLPLGIDVDAVTIIILVKQTNILHQSHMVLLCPSISSPCSLYFFAAFSSWSAWRYTTKGILALSAIAFN